MLIPRRAPLIGLWCLLALWTFFGGLELAEQLQIVPETAAEDQPGQDLDEEALTELASGLKSDVLSVEAPSSATLILAVTEPVSSLFLNSAHQSKWLMPHGPPSQPLYQRLSVYRIRSAPPVEDGAVRTP